ncbi:MAG: TonB-dependent receptor [Sphingobacteriales bacterium]|nr:MAG: TonB-dependent receptor [Sphingobacteriales bacterium]
MRKEYLYLLAFTACSLNVVAQEDSTAKKMDEVIVTGQYKPQSVKNSVYQVKVINRERIEKQAATKLQDVLSNELNIRFSQDRATGGSDITMMGMAGQNVKILLDGMPIIGRQGTSNEININQIDINTIERIEIVEGPMSVIYGADALGGVINIITKKAGLAKWNITARLHEETVGKEYSLFDEGIHNQSAGLTWRNKRWQAGANIGYNYFGGWRNNFTGRELQWHKKDQIIGSGFLQYNTAKFNIRYRVDGLDEIITNPGNFGALNQQTNDRVASDSEYISQRVMQQVQAGYIFNDKLSINVQSSYSDYSRQVYLTLLSANTGKRFLNTAPGAQSQVNFTGFTFRTSATYRLNKIFSFQPGVDINLDRGEGERMSAGTNAVDDYAFFITSEITPDDKISIKPGLRFMKNSIYDAPGVLPSINTKFKLNKNLDFRISYAQGFRAPSVRELYFNFFDANHQIVGNPDLKAETSNSFNASLNWGKFTQNKVAYTTVLSGFFNKVKNLIGYAPSIANPQIFMLTNVSDSKTAGFALQSMAKYRNWNLGVGTSFTGFYNNYSETDKSLPDLQWSAEANITAGYSFTKLGLDVNLFYKLTGKKPFYAIDSSQNFILSKYDAFSLADLTVNKKLFKYFTLNLGVRNLFDVQSIAATIQATGGAHNPGGGGRSIATGRSYFAGLLFNLDLPQKK